MIIVIYGLELERMPKARDKDLTIIYTDQDQFSAAISFHWTHFIFQHLLNSYSNLMRQIFFSHFIDEKSDSEMLKKKTSQGHIPSKGWNVEPCLSDFKAPTLNYFAKLV